MKLIKFLAMMLMAVTMSFGMTACGDDDDEEETGGNNFNQGDISVIYTAKADKLEIEMNSPVLKEVETALFEGDKCTSWKIVFTYSSESYANTAWKQMQEQDLEDIYSKNGKTITCDMGKIAGLEYATYQIVKESFDAKADTYEKQGMKVTRK